MRGLISVRVCGYGTARLHSVPLVSCTTPFSGSHVAGSGTYGTLALTMLLSWIFRRSKLKKNEALLPSGPLTLPLYCSVWYGGWFAAKGFDVLKAEALDFTNTWPCSLSVPGLVNISTRPSPGL